MGNIDRTVFVNYEKLDGNAGTPVNSNAAENVEINQLYQELGKAYYEGAFEDPLPQLLPLFDKITLALKPKEPVIPKCPNCGQEVTANFCGYCGTKVK